MPPNSSMNLGEKMGSHFSATSRAKLALNCQLRMFDEGGWKKHIPQMDSNGGLMVIYHGKK